MRQYFSISAKRDKLLDVLKGIAILLVVLGHAIQYNVADFDNNLLFRVIYSFHMPLFFFLSGYVAKISCSGKKFIFNKFISLVLPFFSWALLVYCLFSANSESLLHHFYLLAISPDRGLWFLLALFDLFCFFVLFEKLSKSINLGTAAFLTAFLIFELPIKIPGMVQVRQFGIYFFLGYFVSQGFTIAQLGKNWKKLSWVLCLFVLIAPFWRRIGPSSLLPKAVSLFTKAGLLSLFDSASLDGFLRVAAAVSGIFTVIIIAQLIKKKYFTSSLAWLGNHTLGIYVTHQLFLNFGVGPLPLKIATTVVLAVCASLLIEIVAKQFKVLDLLFYGNYKLIKFSRQRDVHEMSWPTAAITS